MIKKIAFWLFIVCLLIAGLVMSGKAIIKTGAQVEKDYRIETWEPNHIICVELIIKEVPVRARVEELGKYTSSVEIFKQAIKEISREYNIYSSCPIIESAYPSVFGTWTKALILFVEPKNK